MAVPTPAEAASGALLDRRYRLDELLSEAEGMPSKIAGSEVTKAGSVTIGAVVERVRVLGQGVRVGLRH